MGQHEPLSLFLDDTIDLSFADELLSQFDLKRNLLHSPNTSTPSDEIKDNNNKSGLTANGTSSIVNHISHSTLLSNNQHNNLCQDSAEGVQITPSALSDHTTVLPPELAHNVTLDTTLPLPLEPLITSQAHTDIHQRHHEISMDSTKVKAKSTPASLPGTITDRGHRRRQHNLLRRSSTYLRQRFFAGETTDSPPPLPTLDPTNDNTVDRLGVAQNYIGKDNTHGSVSPLSPPPTPPSSSTPAPPSSSPAPPSTNPKTTTTVTPLLSPCQYPPKPLHYCPVDPPDDRHRTSFPIFPWRKKLFKGPRRQSEPTITSDHIKTRRSFFFL